MIHINDDIHKLYDGLVSIRRDLHRIPEPAFQEYETGEYIKRVLRSLEIGLYDVARTGVLGFLRGTEGKRTIAFRADMDALPVTEKNDCSYISQHEGFMHACGHDGHMTIALGLAKHLSLNKHRVKDNILFIFQPAEEGPGGAEIIVKENILKKFHVEVIYGLHLFPGIEEGKIGIRSGAMMAQNTEIDITIKGKSGHGAMPQSSIDAIVIATEMIQRFQSILTRRIRPTAPALITIGKITGGEARNIIAKEVFLEGIIRTFDDEVYNTIKEALKHVNKSLEIAHNCKIESEFRELYPPVHNDDTVYTEFINSVDKKNIEIIEPQMIAEDFAFYQQKIPGLFFFLGTRNVEKGFIAPLHSANFNFDEKILVTGVQIFLDILEHKKSIRNT